MSSFLWESSSINAFSTTLNGTINDAITTVTLTSVAGLVAPGVIVVERQDGVGNDTPGKREYISFTGISGSDLTGVTRGVAGSTAQSHSSGALVEAILTATHWTDLVDYLQVEHDSAGKHVLSTATITYTETKRLAVTSIASIPWAEFTQIAVTSVASFGFVASDSLLVGGATITKVGLYPTWYIPDNASAATTSLGRPISMPHAGVLTFASITLRSPVSSASLIFDINKDFISIFDAGTRPSILGGGTFVSTASIATKTFAGGSIYNVDLDSGGEYKDTTVTLGAD